MPILININGIYGIGHLCYLISAIILIIIGIILVKLYLKKENQINLLIKISSIFLLITILINRFSVTYNDVVIYHKEGYTWLNLIPSTFCGLASLVLGISCIFGKKDHLLLHGFGYLGFMGGLVTMFYPDFLKTQNFFEIRSLTGLIHHTLMVWLILIAIITGYMKPALKKWYIFPITICIVMTVGLLEKEMFHFPSAMQIGEPLLQAFPILTSWYMVFLGEMIVHLIFLLIWKTKAKTTKKLAF